MVVVPRIREAEASVASVLVRGRAKLPDWRGALATNRPGRLRARETHLSTPPGKKKA